VNATLLASARPSPSLLPLFAGASLRRGHHASSLARNRIFAERNRLHTSKAAARLLSLLSTFAVEIDASHLFLPFRFGPKEFSFPHQ